MAGAVKVRACHTRLKTPVAHWPEKGINNMPTNNNVWTTPALTVYGDVTELTLAKEKHRGVSDGFTFNGVPISG